MTRPCGLDCCFWESVDAERHSRSTCLPSATAPIHRGSGRLVFAGRLFRFLIPGRLIEDAALGPLSVVGWMGGHCFLGAREWVICLAVVGAILSRALLVE